MLARPGLQTVRAVADCADAAPANAAAMAIDLRMMICSDAYNVEVEGLRLRCHTLILVLNG